MWLKSCLAGKDLRGVLVDIWLNVIWQCAQVAKAKGILTCIRNSVAGRTREAVVRFYVALVREHLECCVQLWALQYQKDMDVEETSLIYLTTWKAVAASRMSLLYEVTSDRMWGDSLKLYQGGWAFSLGRFSFFFMGRMVKLWNVLPMESPLPDVCKTCGCSTERCGLEMRLSRSGWQLDLMILMVLLSLDSSMINYYTQFSLLLSYTFIVLRVKVI